MSAYGFTWVYVTSLGVLAQSFSTFKGDDEEDDRALLLIVAIVLVAVGAGVMTARAIPLSNCLQFFSNRA